MGKTLVMSSVLATVLLMSGCGGSDDAKDQFPVDPVQVNNPDIGGGQVLFYTTSGEYKGAANVGNLPDMVTFSHDGKFLVSANEGEPNDDLSVDPKGSVSIIEIDASKDKLVRDVTTLTFDDVAVDADVRIKPGSTASVDLEPEYVAITEDDKKAFISLQENNAIAYVDLEAKTITAVKSLGAKDFDRIDIDSKDDANVATAPDNIFGLYMPDTITSYNVGGADYFITANEGDDRDDWADVYTDYWKASDLLDDEGELFSAQLTTDILDVSGKKKLRVLNDLGKDDNGIYTELYIAGTRSFSIWDAEGRQVFDSGVDFEDTVAAASPTQFNTRVDDTDDANDIQELIDDSIPYEMIGDTAYFFEGVDARSQKKGVEPEALSVIKIGDKVFAYIGLEKQGGLFVYDVTNPAAATMVEYFNDIDYTKLPTQAGDLAPEGMVTFTQDGADYLAVANELSSTVALYELAADGRVTKLDSLQVGGFDEGAAEILSYDPESTSLYATNAEQQRVEIISVADPLNLVVSGNIDFSEYADDLQSVSVKNGLVAIAVKRKDK